ncbi:hypothetical protein [Bacillus toyonensis]|uniref:hypothetical protein n=1 Tax=Bacillus toyonensis TaxID=155322 RepID=UPI00209A73D2|nr:hypothetical protein [Bacillus toyonensis]
MEMKLQSFQMGRGKNILFSQEHLLQEAFQKKKDITLILLKGLHIKGIIGVTIHAHQLKKNKHPQNQKEMTFPNN